MHAKQTALLAALAVGLLAGSPAPVPHVHAQEQMPVSYICTMDPDVLETGPGNCPICKMTLQPVRIEAWYACPVHGEPSLTASPGKCRIDKVRDVVPIVVNHFWDCGEKPEKFYADPGKCADGRPREERRVVRAHGDHNPRHGGQFYMAEDKWHHLEGTFPKDGNFRIFLYDNFTKDLDPAQVRDITGRVAVIDANRNEIESQKLSVSKDGTSLEARFRNASFPIRFNAWLKFKEATREQPFEFNFAEFTTEPAVPPAPATTGLKPAGAPASAAAKPAAAPPPAATPAPPAPAPPPPAPAVAAATPAPPVAPTQLPETPGAPPQPGGAGMFGAPGVPNLAQELPATSAALLQLLDQRLLEVEEFIRDGNFGMIYIPSIQAKEVALALQDRASELPASRHVGLTSGVRRLILAAWRLDQYGDLGDRNRITQAHANFAAAAADIKAAYAPR